MKLDKRTQRSLLRKQELLGQKFITNEGYEVTIIEYKDNRNVTIQFENGYRCIHELVVIKRGNVKNPYHRSMYGVGYIGEGDYPISEGNKRTKCYSTWCGILERSYSDRFHQTHPSYIGCSVAPEWHCYQTFAKWYEENFYEVNNEKMALDKDILVKGNKIYSPETAIFVPQNINSLFIKREKLRGDLPIGVTRKSGNKDKYVARCMNILEGKKVFIGVFDTPEKAFKAYKEYKEDYIKKVADHYKDLIPERLYKALYEYEVEFND